jgi:hypothetical protein
VAAVDEALEASLAALVDAALIPFDVPSARSRER